MGDYRGENSDRRAFIKTPDISARSSPLGCKPCRVSRNGEGVGTLSTVYKVIDLVQNWEPMSRCKSFQICSLFGPNSGDRWEPEGAAPRALRISGNFQNSFLNSVKSGPPVGPRRPSGVDPQHSPGLSGGLWSLLRPLAPPLTF